MAALGNDAAPQRQEQSQAPVLSRDPEPVTSVPEPLEPLLADPVAAEPATTTLEDTPVAEPPAMTAVVPVPF